MKKNYLLLFSILFLFSIGIYAQPNDSIDTVPISETEINQNSQINFDYDENNLDMKSAFYYKTKLHTQKLLKNLFLIGFIFMLLVVGFIFYIYYSKTKEVLKLVKIQEKEIELRQFEVKKLGIILNNTEDSSLIADKNGEIIWANSSFKNIFGSTFEELKKQNKANIFETTNPDIKALHEKCIKLLKPVQYSTETIDNKNNQVWFQRRIIPLIDEEKKEIINFAVIDTDFTALKLAMKK